MIITNLKKLTKVYDVADEKKLIEKMLPQFQKVIKDDADSVILEYFDYESWMMSKIDEVTFEEAVKARN